MAGRSPASRFWHLESFAGGLDRRDGRFTKNQNRFWDLVNYRVLNTKRLKRRPPCARNATAFINASGLIEWRGALYTVAKKGDAVTKPATVTGELRFDNPDHCTTWELAGLLTFSGYPVALIKHTYPGGTVTYQYRLHVFDGKKNKPTYVEDPWCPIGWGPTLPLHAYRTGTVGALDAAWVPRMGVSSGRIYISRPDGNLAFSKTGNARTWNDRTAAQLATEGEWWYFVSNNTVGDQQFIISESYTDVDNLTKWAGYIAEYLDDNGTWQSLNEVMAGPLVANLDYQLLSIVSRFPGGPNEIGLSVRWLTLGAGRIIRLRMAIDTTVEATGYTIDARNYAEKFNGDGVTTIFTATALPGPAHPYLGGVLQTVGFTVLAFTPNFSVQFAVAPPVGVGNVALAIGARDTVVLPNSYSYQGALEGSRAASSQLTALPLFGANSDYLAGLGGGPTLYPVGRYAPLTGSGNTGLTRLRTRWILRFSTGNTGTFPEPLTSDAPYDYTTAAFYLSKILDYQLNQAGADDAGDLPTASQQGSDGGHITALSAMKDRLLVSYKASTQLWQVSGLPIDHLMLGFGPVGTGKQTLPAPAAVGQSVVVGMARGLMSLNLSGSNLDSLRDINLGEPIEELGFPQQQAAAFWPETGQYLTAVTMPDASRQFLVFDHSPEAKISAWSRWTVASLPAVESFTMVPQGNKLHFRAGGYLYTFDLDATDYIDAHDVAGVAYECSAWLHYNHFDSPFSQKQAIGLEWVMRGASTVAIRWNPDLETEETGELVYSGMTAGRAKVPVSVWGVGLAPVIRSRDRTGHEIEDIGMHFIVRGR